MTFGNGVRMSMRAAARLGTEGVGMHGAGPAMACAPLPSTTCCATCDVRHVLVVDETRCTGGVPEGVLAAL